MFSKFCVVFFHFCAFILQTEKTFIKIYKIRLNFLHRNCKQHNWNKDYNTEVVAIDQ